MIYLIYLPFPRVLLHCNSDEKIAVDIMDRFCHSIMQI